VQVSREGVRGIEAIAGEMGPGGLLKDLGVDFAFPEDGKALSLRVILQAGKVNERLFPNGLTSGFNAFYQIPVTANLDDLSGRWQGFTFPACSDCEADMDLPIIYTSTRIPDAVPDSRVVGNIAGFGGARATKTSRAARQPQPRSAIVQSWDGPHL
jgi:hypothetical protein